MKIKVRFIGKNIRYLRRERGWTLAGLADRAGMSEVVLGIYQQILEVLIQARSRALQVVNTEMVACYWQIGRLSTALAYRFNPCSDG